MALQVFAAGGISLQTVRPAKSTRTTAIITGRHRVYATNGYGYLIYFLRDALTLDPILSALAGQTTAGHCTGSGRLPTYAATRVCRSGSVHVWLVLTICLHPVAPRQR